MLSIPDKPHLQELPDELLHHVLWHLDVPDLLEVSRTSHRLRVLALDPHLHSRRLHYSSRSLTRLLPHRPPLSAIQPPQSAIYLSRTHVAARRLHWSLVSIRLNRSLSRRPAVTSLVSANILPRECCRRDRVSGDYVLSVAGERGGLVTERKRKVEREKVKEGLRVWLERKAREIKKRRKDGGVAVLVWRFSRRLKVADDRLKSQAVELQGGEGRVMGLKQFWEGLGGQAGRNAVVSGA
ncbi:hypothetical protein K461DRAFT_320797 [Myriangium duriaei CBS 260.36]|uniref:F-box domain-containing protein n=1 Tax=Myriangium duriaei CBS 260.36 TaxID=1168546 RepID=A0A9P4J067_9PEZI|nr:hypothetical protein K461DRAFT_320797 [Myriangium duriaei CBS 260.36]